MDEETTRQYVENVQAEIQEYDKGSPFAPVVITEDLEFSDD